MAAFYQFVDVSRPKDFTLLAKPQITVVPARQFWNPKLYDFVRSKVIGHDDRPNAPAGNFFWAGNREEAGQFLHAYRSAWLPQRLLEKEHQRALADALFAASRHWTVSLHFNKGLAGATRRELAAARDGDQSGCSRCLSAGNRGRRQRAGISGSARTRAESSRGSSQRRGGQRGDERIAEGRAGAGFVRLRK